MRWHLHGTIIEGTSDDASVAAQWERSFASLPESDRRPEIKLQLNVVDEVPPAPVGEPQFRQGKLLAYYLDGSVAIAHFPRYGLLRLELAAGVTEGQIVGASVRTYGVLEDLIAIGLSAHLRRRGMFLLHAFAAAREDRAVLLVGGIGAGKTTTGMSLLAAGWQLLSNDSPLIAAGGEALTYPGVLAAYPETFARFESTRHLVETLSEWAERRKLTVAADNIWPDVWVSRAQAGAILFPEIHGAGKHALDPLGAADTLRRLLPHAVEQWDREMIGPHLRVLRQLAEVAPGYRLLLGPDVAGLPEIISAGLR